MKTGFPFPADCFMADAIRCGLHSAQPGTLSPEPPREAEAFPSSLLAVWHHREKQTWQYAEASPLEQSGVTQEAWGSHSLWRLSGQLPTSLPFLFARMACQHFTAGRQE